MISVTVDEGCQERSLFLAERWNINLSAADRLAKPYDGI